MSFAEHLINLRQEIDGLRAKRMELRYQLNRFRADLHASSRRSMAELRKSFERERSQARAARRSFIAHNRESVAGMLAAFGAERSAAHHNFRGKRA